MADVFYTAVIALCNTLAVDAALLTQKADPQTASKLAEAPVDAIGKHNRNGVTNQEARFAEVAETLGFKFLGKQMKPDEGEMYYKYEVKGSQQPGDFQLLFACDGNHHDIVFELKHTQTQKIMLNDGWFHDDVVYVITYNNDLKKKAHKPKVHIAFGRNIAQSEDTIKYQNIRQRIAQLNNEIRAEDHLDSSFRIFVRCANQYDCRKFDSKQSLALAHLESKLNNMIQDKRVADDISELLKHVQI